MELAEGAGMDAERAKELLRLDRSRTEALLKEMEEKGKSDRTEVSEQGDMFDAAQPLVDEGLDDSVRTSLEDHLAALERAEGRLEAGTYGYSIKSGQPIPDDRLEADPSAELTIDEARHDGVASI
jgi:DnaK suppressor protein